MVVRYMGTKRHMADHVRDAIAELEPAGRVVDLFSGMGSVAESLQETASVVTNDAMSFTAALSRARFTGSDRETTSADVIKRLKPAYEARRRELELVYATELNSEVTALEGSRTDLLNYMDKAQHVGNSTAQRRTAKAAAESSGSDHYALASLYFSAGYLSLRQAVQLDAARAAIDADSHLEDRDWMLAAWIAATSVLVNAPGHTAQFLRPNSDSAHTRIVRTWTRSIWDEFTLALDTVSQVGTESWRRDNSVYVGDALDLVSAGELRDIGTVYADPPYTKDQYSRYYHMYETLYRYDFPDSSGAGRNRSDRFTTGFSLKSAVVASFHDLCRNVSRMRVPLVISYPSSGLLDDAGVTVPEIARQYFGNVQTRSYNANHSTMGASTGASKKSATENLYVCLV
ncbi:DNA adenine methylase [Microbacterium dextranolyticum]|uniref:Site-specific DNA-methyltransferase n=1 Tax=Microbacterium dextranolyticum TaxID=36806 RepID=A0A9W6HPN6_9MICO|nr:DNA adenine methylase [Microbacterium dextranolyticum]MBM7462557.1 adenine-specific DNA-methyltransferase [Microbacterium dextranolyticum]GLJ96415.1 site-specific DNA-methyltransferase [Microbacterium dextranolyticum]